MRRLRIEFAKHGKVRFVSHRDVARIWERALRRAGVPVAYSEGFSPRPRLSFGLALPTGYESDAEYLDVHISTDDRDRPDGGDGCDDGDRPVAADPYAAAGTDALGDVLSGHLPTGMTVSRVREIERRLPSLQEAVTSCTWRISIADADAAAVEAAAAQALRAEQLVVTRIRKGKEVTDDIRPLVLSLEIAESEDFGSLHGRHEACVLLIAELGTQPRAVRVPELLAALDPAISEQRVHRTHQWTLTPNGMRIDPMGVEAPLPAAPEAK